MSNHVIKGLSDFERMKAKSYADELFHNAPQTAKFFDPNISLSEIKSRHEQKQEARDRGDSLKVSETMKYFERNNVTTITHDLRPSFNQYFEFAYARGNRGLYSACSHKTMHNYVQFLENRVKERKITPDTFNEYLSRMRILASMVTATEGLPELNIDEMTKRASYRIDNYVKEMKNTDNPVINDKHKVRAYKGDELERIINRLEKDGNYKIATTVRVIEATAFRIENASSIPLNTQWRRIGYRNFEREFTPDNKIAIVSKGNQKHTVTLSPELFDKLEKYADSDGKFIIDQNEVREAVKKACEKEGIKFISIHNLRATVAYRLYRDLKATGHSEQDARQIVSNQLYHGRTDITMYYINSANKGEED